MSSPILTRKENQSVILYQMVKTASDQGNKIRLRVDAEEHVVVLREEVWKPRKDRN